MVKPSFGTVALANELPASFVAFDVLAVAGQDTRGVPFTGRRQLLEELARDWAKQSLMRGPRTQPPDDTGLLSN